MSVSQFDEIAADTCFAIREIRNRKSILVECVKEGGCYLRKVFLGILFHFPELGSEVFEKVFLFHHFIERLGGTLVIIAEDIFTKTLDFTDHVPTFVISHIRLDIVHDPVQKPVGLPQILNQLVYSLLLHLVVVEPYAKVGGKVELTCQVTKHTLEESIYCFNAKVVVVVNEQTECSTGILLYLLLREMGQSFLYLFQITLRFLESMGNTI